VLSNIIVLLIKQCHFDEPDGRCVARGEILYIMQSENAWAYKFSHLHPNMATSAGS